MKSVVMIAYGFPPEGNAGVYRALRFVRHLPSLGWHPTVVTLDTDVYERYDPELVTMVPAGVDIIRAGNIDPWITFQEWRTKRIWKIVSTLSREKVLRIHKSHRGRF